MAHDLWHFSKSKFYLKSDRVNLVALASTIECQKLKCTMATCGQCPMYSSTLKSFVWSSMKMFLNLKTDYIYIYLSCGFFYKSDLSIFTAGKHAGNIRIKHFLT